MARIRVVELHPIGSELFEDSESFLDELHDSEIAKIKGGLIGLGLENYLLNLYGIAANGMNADSYALTVVSARGNSVNNNTINGQTINALSLGNVNTI
jgi:hypothetical protein